MSRHHKIDYLEFQSSDIAVTKAFFSEVFGWQYTDYGDDYVAFHGAGIEGGFFKSDCVSQSQGSALIVFYSDELEQTLADVEQAGGNICKPVFDFPGGRRFHFTEPSGHEFAVWTEAQQTVGSDELA